MCNTMLCRSLVVFAVLLLLLMRWGGDGANRTHETDTGVGLCSFGTYDGALAPSAHAPSKVPNEPHPTPISVS